MTDSCFTFLYKIKATIKTSLIA